MTKKQFKEDVEKIMHDCKPYWTFGREGWKAWNAINDSFTEYFQDKRKKQNN